MASKCLVSALPDDIRLQLHKRLIESDFYEYGEHSSWLKSLGHPIGRSTVHRYATKNEARIRHSFSDREPLSENEKFIIDIRMRCLEVSSGFAEADFDQLFKKGEVVLNWVKSA